MRDNEGIEYHMVELKIELVGRIKQPYKLGLFANDLNIEQSVIGHLESNRSDPYRNRAFDR